MSCGLASRADRAFLPSGSALSAHSKRGGDEGLAWPLRPRGCAGSSAGLNFMGSPDTVVKQIKQFHDECGAGVVDLFFQQPGVTHQEVMREIDLGLERPGAGVHRPTLAAAMF